jgi:hypothetical protein
MQKQFFNCPSGTFFCFAFAQFILTLRWTGVLLASADFRKRQPLAAIRQVVKKLNFQFIFRELDCKINSDRFI